MRAGRRPRKTSHNGAPTLYRPNVIRATKPSVQTDRNYWIYLEWHGRWIGTAVPFRHPFSEVVAASER